jgi:hypothetical protein
MHPQKASSDMVPADRLFLFPQSYLANVASTSLYLLLPLVQAYASLLKLTYSETTPKLIK